VENIQWPDYQGGEVGSLGGSTMNSEQGLRIV
jgi:hypothetical protein